MKLPLLLMAGDWPSIAALSEPGRTLLGAMVGGFAGGALMRRELGAPPVGDRFAAPAAMFVGIGRLTCLITDCCFGAATTLPWALDFGDGIPRHPAPLYESAFHLAACTVLTAARSRGLWRGQLASLYLLAYLAFRFASEFIRAETPIFGPWTSYQAACLLLLPVFGGLWLCQSALAERRAYEPGGDGASGVRALRSFAADFAGAPRGLPEAAGTGTGADTAVGSAKASTRTIAPSPAG